MSGSMSGRDLMVVSTAAALGGGLVAALAFNAGSHFASGDSGGGGGGWCERRSLECFNKFLPRWLWLQWVRVCLILLHTLIWHAYAFLCVGHFVMQCVFGFLNQGLLRVLANHFLRCVINAHLQGFMENYHNKKKSVKQH
jgi:hypothetical protein